MINNNLFKVETPLLNPLGLDYINFWKQEKKRCIEGYWVGGKYMPGVAYQYINHWKIELNEGKNSKNKVINHPRLRDLEWEKSRMFLEARGFSGFEHAKYHTCDRDYEGKIMFYDEYENRKILNPTQADLEEISKNSKRYTPISYVHARDYLQWEHGEDLGRPLMENSSKNVVDIESRGTGKSFFASNMIGWNFLHDGVFAYDDLLLKPKSETMIGAIDTKYSSGLIKKVKLGLEHLTGAIELGDTYYPPPLLKKYSGSWESGKTITAEYEVKIGDSWVKKGSKSMIYHRSFGDNPMAGNGTRPGFIALEEVGFMHNLELALGQLAECTKDGINKFGTIWMFGTGGDMDGGSTEAVKRVFYEPNAHDCLVFDDIYENKGKIGYFCPAWKGLNQFKDEQGNTNEEIAKDFLFKEREKKANAKTKQALYDELQQRPIVPSEAFLIKSGNVFPTVELKEHQAFLESNEKTKNLATNGRMMRDHEGKVYFKPMPDLIACDYPTNHSVDFSGAVQVWEPPNEDKPFGLYIAGIDPYDQDKAENSPSLGSIIIYKRMLNADQTYHLPVAEYTARPEFASDFYEECRRLLEWYGATALYENEKTGLKSYFETKQCLHLLHRQPSIINTVTPNSKVDRKYGTHMTTQIKEQIEIWTRDWLKTELEPGIMQLTKIHSIPLIKELIGYNADGNFDRVIAFMLCIMQNLDMHKIVVDEHEAVADIDPFFQKKLFVK